MKTAIASIAIAMLAPLVVAAERGGSSSESGSNQQPGSPTRELSRRNGGSLFKASIATRMDNPTGKPIAGSFLFVAEPEPKTVKKHDLITIIIREESTSKTSGTTDLKKESAVDAKVEDFIKMLNNYTLTGGGVATPNPAIKMASARNFKGEGTVDRSDSFTARVTAEVIDVKPNNTIVVQATKHITNDGEQQFFTLTGICRVEDISPDNSVLSTQLADPVVTKTSKGQVKNTNERGLIYKAFDAINPF